MVTSGGKWWFLDGLRGYQWGWPKNPGVCSGVLRLVVLLSARIASCETSPRWKIQRKFRQPESHGVEIYLTPLLIQIGRSEGRWWAQERKWGWGRPAHFWRGMTKFMWSVVSWAHGNSPPCRTGPGADGKLPDASVKVLVCTADARKLLQSNPIWRVCQTFCYMMKWKTQVWERSKKLGGALQAVDHRCEASGITQPQTRCRQTCLFKNIVSFIGFWKCYIQFNVILTGFCVQSGGNFRNECPRFCTGGCCL